MNKAGNRQQLTDLGTKVILCRQGEFSSPPDVPCIRETRFENLVSSAASGFNPSSIARLQGHPVIRFPEQLRLHPALDAVGWIGSISELNDAVQFNDQAVSEPILITPNGTILAGFARWRLAAFDGRRELHCIEYVLSEEECLRFIIAYHRPHRGWNAFVRIRLALTLEPYFQHQALANMSAGGKHKGLAYVERSKS